MQIISTLVPNLRNSIYGDTNGANVGCCCYNIKLELVLSPGDFPRFIDDIFLNTTTGTDFLIISVDGLPWASPLATPFWLDSNNSLEIVVQICNWKTGGAPPAPANFFNSGIIRTVWSVGASSGSYDLPISNFKVLDIDSVNYNPFFGLNWLSTNYYACELASPGCNNDIVFEFNTYNHSNVALPITLDLIPSTGNISAPTYYVNGNPIAGNVVELPPGNFGFNYTKIGVGFCTDSVQSVGFTIQPCSTGGCFTERRVDLTITPIYCTPAGSTGLDCLDLVLSTNTGGVSTISDSVSYCDSDCSPIPDGYHTASVGEEKVLKHTLNYVQGFYLGGVEIWYNPSLYEQYCDPSIHYTGLPDTPPDAGYYFNVPDSIVGDGNYYDMIQFANGLPQSIPSNKNWRVQIKILTVNTFEIKHTFYLWADLDNWITNRVFQNNDKLFYSDVNTQSQLITQGTVYSQWKNICSFVFVRDPNVLVTYNGIKQPSFFYLSKCVPITIRHWDVGLFYNNYVPEFTNPEFILERNGTAVQTLSNVSRTKLKFRITNPSGNGINDVVFWLWKRNTTDDNSNFFVATDSSRANVTFDPTTTTLDNHLETPSTLPTLISANRYECTCYIGTNLQANADYILGAIVYSENDQIINSFLYDGSIFIDTTVDISDLCCPLDVASSWYDLFNRYNDDCIRPILKERIGHNLTIEPGDFQDCLDAIGITGSWHNYLTDIKLNIYRQENYAPANPPVSNAQDILIMFEQYQSLYNQSAQGYFINQSPDFIAYYDLVSNSIKTNWTGRVRYEDNLIPASGQCFLIDPINPMLRTPAAGGATTYIQQNNITYNWADKDIWFEYIFTFDFSAYFGTPTSISFTYRPRIKPWPYEPGTLLASITFTGYIGGSPELININLPICIDKYDYIEVEVMDTGDGLVGEFIAFIDKFPYGINNLIEGDEPGSNTTYLPVLTNQVIFNVTDFNTKGNFSFNPSLLQPGKYQICGAYIELT
jgi:hypothetical protein